MHHLKQAPYVDHFQVLWYCNICMYQYAPLFLGYVVRWKYCVKLTGVKTLKGKQSRYEDVGRDKVAYFFWQGKDSTLNEKGTAALMTVELDSDKGPQVWLRSSLLSYFPVVLFVRCLIRTFTRSFVRALIRLLVCSALFLCSWVYLFHCSSFNLFLCSSVNLLLCPSVPLSLCSSVPPFLCLFVPLFFVSLFLPSSVAPFLRCSPSSTITPSVRLFVLVFLWSFACFLVSSFLRSLPVLHRMFCSLKSHGLEFKFGKE